MPAFWGVYSQDAESVSHYGLTDPALYPASSADESVIAQAEGAVRLAEVGERRDAAGSRKPPPLHLVVMVGRLDNRADLIEKLSLRRANSLEPENRELIAYTYEKWGDDCVHWLLGDWAFALWDRRCQRLLLARDPCGRCSLFYAEDSAGRLLFATNLQGILCRPGLVRRLNPDYIAQQVPGILREGTATPYLGVRRLPPGWLLTASNERLDVKQYWSPKSVPEVRCGSHRAYTEGFADVFHEAVQCRIADVGGPIGTFLSGGLDSGAVATEAASLLSPQERRLWAFGAVPAFPIDGPLTESRMGDESSLMSAVATCAGNIDLVTLPSTHVSVMEGIRAVLRLTGEPLFAPGNAFWYLDVLRQASERGLGVLLCGEGGNLTVSYAGDHHEHVKALVRARNWSMLAQEALGLVHRLGGRSRRLVSRPRLPNGRTLPHAMNPVFLARYPPRQKRANWKAYRHEYPTAQAHLIGRYLSEAVLTRAWPLAAHFGIEIRDPTMDRRVVEYCLGLPRDQFRSAGESRMVIRRAMAGRMPETVLSNRRRGLQAADIGRRVMADHAEVHETLSRLEKAPAAQYYLDLEAMRSVLNRLKRRPEAQVGDIEVGVFLQGLQVGLFLLNFDEEPAVG